MSGVNAPPQRALSQRMAWARSRSCFGIHVVKARVMLGKHPASPAPKSVRTTSREVSFHTQPVAAVKNDHQITMRIRTRRGPRRSPSQPPGISKSAYAQEKTENAQAI